MSNYKEALETITFAEKAEKSLKEFNNWIFGISIGIYSILIFKFNDIDFSKYECAQTAYKIIIIYSMITVFCTGLSKYHIMMRENKLSIRFGVLLKLLILKNKTPEIEFESKWNREFKKWADEHNKIVLMSKFLNLSIIMTSILIIAVAIFLIIII